MRQGFEDIVAFLKEKINGIVQKVKDAVNPAKAVKSVGSSIKSGFKKLFGFADGGIVTGPTAALIGEAGDTEAVLPLGRFESIFGPILKKMEPGGEKFEKLAKQISNMGTNFTRVSQVTMLLAKTVRSFITQAIASLVSIQSQMESVLQEMEKAAIRMTIASPPLNIRSFFGFGRNSAQRDDNQTSLSDVVSAINRLHVAIESIDLDVKMDGTRVAEMVHVHNSFRRR
jgi:hypothetical protein